jgi:putative NADH-flavin reductase
VRWNVANVLDPDSIASVIGGLDVVVNAINAGNTISETIDNADVLPSAARALLVALEQHPSIRLLVAAAPAAWRSNQACRSWTCPASPKDCRRRSVSPRSTRRSSAPTERP